MTTTESATSLDRSPAQLWTAARTPLLVIAGTLVLIAVVVFVSTARSTGPLSPDSTEPTGAKALAVLLDDHHVRVVETDALADATSAGAGRTLLIAPSGALAERHWQAIDRAGWDHLVLIQPPARGLEVLAPGVARAGDLSWDSREADCELTAAVRAGPAAVGGLSYSAPEPADSCYGDGIHGSVIRTTRGGRTVDVVGTPATFSNDRLADQGNAALALNLLGTHAELVWYLPRFEGDDEDDGPPLTPSWLRYVLWMIAITTLMVALWRGRRLGPVVPEALPVVVHAAETTEGRARLYRRSRARDRAAAALRESTVAAVGKALGLGRSTEPAAVVGAVAARTARDPAILHDLLYGGPPDSDAVLLGLSGELDALIQEVRRP